MRWKGDIVYEPPRRGGEWSNAEHVRASNFGAMARARRIYMPDCPPAKTHSSLNINKISLLASPLFAPSGPWIRPNFANFTPACRVIFDCHRNPRLGATSSRRAICLSDVGQVNRGEYRFIPRWDNSVRRDTHPPSVTFTFRMIREDATDAGPRRSTPDRDFFFLPLSSHRVNGCSFAPTRNPCGLKRHDILKLPSHVSPSRFASASRLT